MNKMKVIKRYKKDDLTVIWEPGRCIHSTKCATGLPSVFRDKERPWVQLDHATKEEIMKQIDQCPSGALSYVVEGVSVAEEKELASIRVNAGASLRIQGPLMVTLPDGTIEEKEMGASFCRCGASNNKPFCDGSHREIEFDK